MTVLARTTALLRPCLVAAAGILLIVGCAPDSPTSAEIRTHPRYQLGEADAGTFAYVANVHSGDISVIETTGHTVVTTIAVGGIPGGVAGSPDGAFAYVTDRTGRIWVIETASNTLVRTIALGVSSGGVDDIAISPDGQLAYVTHRNAGNVSVVEIGTGSVLTTIPVGQLPSRIALSSNGTRAYVVNFLSNNVSVIETNTHTIVQTIPVGTFPNDIAISSDGGRAYVANWGSSSVSVIDLAVGSVIQTIPVAGAFTLNLSTDNAALFVASWSIAFKGVTRIATATNSIAVSFPVTVEQANIELTPDAAFAYLTDFSGPSGNGHSVVVVDTRTNSTVAVIGVGEAPFGMAMITPIEVRTPAELIEDLVDGIRGLVGVELNSGQAKGLTQPLTNALRSVSEGRIAAACSQVEDFISEVIAKTPPLSTQSSALLVAEANTIQTAIGCPD